jgi:hypothetical protein
VEYRGVAAPFRTMKHRYVYLLFKQKQYYLTTDSWTSTFNDRNVTNLLKSVSTLGLGSIVGMLLFTSCWHECVDAVHDNMRWLPPTANLSHGQLYQSSWMYYDRYKYQPNLKAALISDRDKIGVVSVLIVSSSLAMGGFGQSTSSIGTIAVCFQSFLFVFAFLALISAIVEALLLNKQSHTLTYENYKTITKYDYLSSWLLLILTLFILPFAIGMRFIADIHGPTSDDGYTTPNPRRTIEIAIVASLMVITFILMCYKMMFLSVGNIDRHWNVSYGHFMQAFINRR